MNRFWRAILILGIVSAVLHGINIAYVLHCSERDGVEYYTFDDTASYINNSRAMFEEQPMSPLFHERVVYSFLLAVVNAAGLPYHSLIWLTVPMEVPAVMCMALLGLLLTRRKYIAVISAVIYVLNPNSYQISASLLPDWLNGQCALISMALTLNWVLNGHKKSGYAACFMIPFTQMIRPTTFPMIVPLLILLFRKDSLASHRRTLNGLLCLSALAYPLLTTAINYSLYGVPRPLLAPGLQLHHGYVSTIRAMLRNAETPGSITEYYFDEKHNVALKHPAEVAIDSYGNSPIRADFASNYYHIVQMSKEIISQHPGLRLEIMLTGAQRYLFFAPSFSPGVNSSHLYPDWSSTMRKLHWMALVFTLCGAALMVRRLDPRVTLFILCWVGIVGLVLVGTHHDSVRVRLLIDLMFIPFFAVGLLSVPTWISLFSLVLIAYGPRRFLGASHEYMLIASAVVAVISTIVLAAISGKNQDEQDDRPGSSG